MNKIKPNSKLIRATNKNLLRIVPIAYILWWFYTLIFSVKPALDISWDKITAWTVVGTILFFTGGAILLIICLLLLFALLN